jgi:cation:H+ antiporter
MPTHALQFLGGLVLLLVGGRLLVSASVDTAKRLGVSPLVVGLTLVAWGTSAPELALNLISASKDRGDLAVGNIVGANICNMALVLGACSLIRPLPVEQRLIAVEVRLSALLLTGLAAIGLSAGIQRFEPALMMFVFGAYSAWTVMAGLRTSERIGVKAAGKILGDLPAQPAQPMSWLLICAAFAGGLALLAYGGSLASDSASEIAIALGVPSAVVGVTIVSIGTTLPELITGIMAVRRGQTDLALGNALGSCLFNTGAVFGIAALISPPRVDATFTVPLVYMAVLAIALVPMTRTFGRTLSRREGALLVTSYAAFLAYSSWSALGPG